MNHVFFAHFLSQSKTSGLFIRVGVGFVTRILLLVMVVVRGPLSRTTCILIRTYTCTCTSGTPVLAHFITPRIRPKKVPGLAPTLALALSAGRLVAVDPRAALGVAAVLELVDHRVQRHDDDGGDDGEEQVEERREDLVDEPVEQAGRRERRKLRDADGPALGVAGRLCGLGRHREKKFSVDFFLVLVFRVASVRLFCGFFDWSRVRVEVYWEPIW